MSEASFWSGPDTLWQDVRAHRRYNLGMRFRLALLALLFVFAQSPSLPAKDVKWFEVSSEHFLLFTNTNEMKGRRLVSDFENRVAAFEQAFGKVPPRQFPTEIFLSARTSAFISPSATAESALLPASNMVTLVSLGSLCSLT